MNKHVPYNRLIRPAQERKARLLLRRQRRKGQRCCSCVRSEQETAASNGGIHTARFGNLHVGEVLSSGWMDPTKIFKVSLGSSHLESYAKASIDLSAFGKVESFNLLLQRQDR